MRIQILYYSGAGNTKFIATILGDLLVQKGHNVNSVKISEKSINNLTDDFDVLYLGFPVYFRDAPKLVYKIFEKLNGKNRPIMIFITKGLYSGNAIKNIFNISVEKDFIPLGFLDLLMPGTDLLTSFIKANSLFEKIFTNMHSININKRINAFNDKIENIVKVKPIRKKWYTIFDNLIVRKMEKIIGNDHKDWIKELLVNENECIKCMKCVNSCPRGNIKYDEKIVIGENCDICLYCINNCPKYAINISGKTKDKVKYSEEKIKKIFSIIGKRQTST